MLIAERDLDKVINSLAFNDKGAAVTEWLKKQHDYGLRELALMAQMLHLIQNSYSDHNSNERKGKPPIEIAEITNKEIADADMEENIEQPENSELAKQHQILHIYKLVRGRRADFMREFIVMMENKDYILSKEVSISDTAINDVPIMELKASGINPKEELRIFFDNMVQKSILKSSSVPRELQSNKMPEITVPDNLEAIAPTKPVWS